LNKEGWTSEYNREAAEAIAYSSRVGEMVTYDNRQSMMDKVDYINSLNLGGAMIWTLDFDDFSGSFCNEGKYPLLKTINQVNYAP
jgi:chitinase